MALVKCKECGREHSDSAAACPHCGQKAIAQASAASVVLVLLVAGIMFSCIMSSPSKAPAEAPRDQKSAADIKADVQREHAFQKVVATIRSIKSASRDPDSVVFESIGSNDDASIVCVEFRARNGFGGMNRETAVLAKGKISQSSAVWNKSCVHKRLIDQSHADHAI